MPNSDDTTTNEDIDFFSEEARQVLLLFFVGTITLAERLALAVAQLVQIVETLNSEEDRERIVRKAMRDLPMAGQRFTVRRTVSAIPVRLSREFRASQARFKRRLRTAAARMQEVQRTTKR